MAAFLRCSQPAWVTTGSGVLLCSSRGSLESRLSPRTVVRWERESLVWCCWAEPASLSEQVTATWSVQSFCGSLCWVLGLWPEGGLPPQTYSQGIFFDPMSVGCTWHGLGCDTASKFNDCAWSNSYVREWTVLCNVVHMVGFSPWRVQCNIFFGERHLQNSGGGNQGEPALCS